MERVPNIMRTSILWDNDHKAYVQCIHNISTRVWFAQVCCDHISFIVRCWQIHSLFINIHGCFACTLERLIISEETTYRFAVATKQNIIHVIGANSLYAINQLIYVFHLFRNI